MYEKAIELIENRLKPSMLRGRRIDRIVLYVSNESKIAELASVETIYGTLRICSNDRIPKGVSYIMEDPGEIGRAFAWVVRKDNKENETVSQK
jgi:hypothetical protein